MRICRRVAGSPAWRFFFMRCPSCRNCQCVFRGSLRAPSWVGSRPSQPPVSGLGSPSLRSFPSPITQTFPWPEPPSCDLLCLSGRFPGDRQGNRHQSQHLWVSQGKPPSTGLPDPLRGLLAIFQAFVHSSKLSPVEMMSTLAHWARLWVRRSLLLVQHCHPLLFS